MFANEEALESSPNHTAALFWAPMLSFPESTLQDFFLSEKKNFKSNHIQAKMILQISTAISTGVLITTPLTVHLVLHLPQCIFQASQ